MGGGTNRGGVDSCIGVSEDTANKECEKIFGSAPYESLRRWVISNPPTCSMNASFTGGVGDENAR